MSATEGKLEDRVSLFLNQLNCFHTQTKTITINAFARDIKTNHFSFAPLDLPRRDALSQCIELFNILNIPSEFTKERLQSVSHSFGRATDNNGSSTWFHFLCKNIDVKQAPGSSPEVDNRAATMGYHVSNLPQADYSWHRAGFFLRVENGGGTTLVCFGASPRVRLRINEFVAAKAWQHVATDPYILFDLVFDALYFEVDDTVWKMNSVFGPLEHVSCLPSVM